ncbi:MAG: nucleoside phosphorylase [Saprospiraceae bacterium]|nr:nucleoside phosphorylase [Saprospiraceae bacterium]
METNWILNPDGSIYHLKLKPGDLAPIILSVGDPDRVQMVSKHLDHIELQVKSREFHTITGSISGKRISILSTGIGTDNIDIVMNEVDALFNIDLKTGESKEKVSKIKWIRLGTSGAIQNDIPVDSILLTDWSIGADSLSDYYQPLSNQAAHMENGIRYFVFRADPDLFLKFQDPAFGIANTFTSVGFYGPQGRSNRIRQTNLLVQLENLNLKGIGKISNLEMETSAIYCLSHLFGFQSISVNAILANRISGRFSKSPEKTIERMIEICFEKISGL